MKKQKNRKKLKESQRVDYLLDESKHTDLSSFIYKTSYIRKPACSKKGKVKKRHN